MGPVMPFIPLIAAAVGGGATLYAQHQAGKTQQNLMNQQKQLAQQQQQQGAGFQQQAQQAIGPTLNYYTSALADPRAATAPEQNRISSLYAGSVANAMNQGIRGGQFGPSQASNLQQQERAQREQVIQQGRPMAASALASMGPQLAGLGLQSQGLGAGIYGNIFQQGLQANQQQYQQSQGIGSGLFNAYQAYLLGNAMQPGGSNYSLPSGSGMYLPSGISGNFSDLTPGSSTYGPNMDTSVFGGTSSTTPNSGPSGLYTGYQTPGSSTYGSQVGNP